MHIDYCVRAGVCWMKSSMSSATYRRLKSVTIGNVGLNSLERGHEQWRFQSLQESFPPPWRGVPMLSAVPLDMILFHTKRYPRSNRQSRGIQEYPLSYSALLVPAILLVPASRADGSSQPPASAHGRGTYRRSVSCLETQLIICYLSGSHA